jgi:hypothetical protein
MDYHRSGSRQHVFAAASGVLKKMVSARANAGSKRQAVAYRFSRVHHALQVGSCLTVKLRRAEPVSVFLRQSDLDSACGLHTMAMMLTILGLAKGTALAQMSHRKFGIPADVWKTFQHTYFKGVDPLEMVELVQSLNLPLHVSVREERDGDVDKFAMRCAMRGELVALAFASIKNQRTRHWALCIGCGGSMIGRTATTDTLLLLDPSAGEPSYRVWNARLRVPATYKRRANATKAIAWQYESADWPSEPARLLAAVRFRLADWP